MVQVSFNLTPFSLTFLSKKFFYLWTGKLQFTLNINSGVAVPIKIPKRRCEIE